MKLHLNNVRIAFPVLTEPKPFGTDPSSKPAYSATLIVDGGDKATVDAIKKALTDIAKEQWKDKAAGVFKTLSETGKLCAYGGDRKADYEGFEGNFVVACRSKGQPLIIDGIKNKIDPNKIYAGCYVNAVVEFWAQDNAYGKRINCEIKGVQFVRDGDSFGGGGAPASADDFEPLAGADDGGFGDVFGE